MDNRLKERLREELDKLPLEDRAYMRKGLENPSEYGLKSIKPGRMYASVVTYRLTTASACAIGAALIAKGWEPQRLDDHPGELGSGYSYAYQNCIDIIVFDDALSKDDGVQTILDLL